MHIRNTTLLLVSVLALSAAANPDENAVAAAEAGRSANSFGLDLFLRLDDTTNLFFSPYSVYAALGMAFAGARGRTEKEMAATLRLPAGQEAAYSYIASLKDRLDSISARGQVRLSTANALWCRKGLSMQDSFLDVQRRYFATGVDFADFKTNPEGERLRINKWAEERTQHRIKDLIPPDFIDTATAMVLCNALYFKGRWASIFDSTRTRKGDFLLSDGSRIKVPLMALTGSFRIAHSKGFSVLELPYSGGEMSFVVFLPDSTRHLRRMESDLGKGAAEKSLTELMASQPIAVSVVLPRFKAVSGFEFSTPLKAMGIQSAFERKGALGGADFSGIFKDKEIFIKAVLHKAYVEVNEKGSEAAAATAVLMRLGARLPKESPEIFRADRPFTFLIRDNRTGVNLFAGRVVNPGK